MMRMIREFFATFLWPGGPAAFAAVGLALLAGGPPAAAQTAPATEPRGPEANLNLPSVSLTGLPADRVLEYHAPVDFQARVSEPPPGVELKVRFRLDPDSNGSGGTLLCEDTTITDGLAACSTNTNGLEAGSAHSVVAKLIDSAGTERAKSAVASFTIGTITFEEPAAGAAIPVGAPFALKADVAKIRANGNLKGVDFLYRDASSASAPEVTLCGSVQPVDNVVSCNWTPPSSLANAKLNLVARAVMNVGPGPLTAKASGVSITPAANPPSIMLTAPKDPEFYYHAPVEFRAQVSNSPTGAKVRFFRDPDSSGSGGTRLCNEDSWVLADGSAACSTSTDGLEAGSAHTLVAKLIVDGAEKVKSPVASFTIGTIKLTAPAAGASIPAGVPFLLKADVTKIRANGNLKHVEFLYRDASGASAPEVTLCANAQPGAFDSMVSCNWTPPSSLANAKLNLIARAVMNVGPGPLTAKAGGVSITPAADSPSITLAPLSPDGVLEYYAPVEFQAQVSAPPAGVEVKVRFFRDPDATGSGGTLLCEDTTITGGPAACSTNTNGLEAGSAHTIVAKLLDSAGTERAKSTVASFTIGTIHFSKPAAGASIPAGTAFKLEADVAKIRTGGILSRVDFLYRDAASTSAPEVTLCGNVQPDASGKVSCDWTPATSLANAKLSLIARAFMKDGVRGPLTAEASGVSITPAANSPSITLAPLPPAGVLEYYAPVEFQAKVSNRPAGAAKVRFLRDPDSSGSGGTRLCTDDAWIFADGSAACSTNTNGLVAGSAHTIVAKLMVGETERAKTPVTSFTIGTIRFSNPAAGASLPAGTAFALQADVGRVHAGGILRYVDFLYRDASSASAPEVTLCGNVQPGALDSMVSCNWTPAASLANAKLDLIARAVMIKAVPGPLTAEVSGVSITPAADSPSITLTGLPDDRVLAYYAPVEFQARVSAPPTGAKVKFFRDPDSNGSGGTLVCEDAAITGGLAACSANTDGLAAGSAHSVVAKLIDSAGTERAQSAVASLTIGTIKFSKPAAGDSIPAGAAFTLQADVGKISAHLSYVDVLYQDASDLSALAQHICNDRKPDASGRVSCDWTPASSLADAKVKLIARAFMTNTIPGPLTAEVSGVSITPAAGATAPPVIKVHSPNKTDFTKGERFDFSVTAMPPLGSGAESIESIELQVFDARFYKESDPGRVLLSKSCKPSGAPADAPVGTPAKSLACSLPIDTSAVKEPGLVLKAKATSVSGFLKADAYYVSPEIRIKPDVLAPVVAFLSPNPAIGEPIPLVPADGKATLRVKAEDLGGVTAVEFFLDPSWISDGQALGSAEAKEGGTYELLWKVEDVKGRHTLRAVARDAASNRGEAKVVIDVRPPSMIGPTIVVESPRKDQTQFARGQVIAFSAKAYDAQGDPGGIARTLLNVFDGRKTAPPIASLDCPKAECALDIRTAEAPFSGTDKLILTAEASGGGGRSVTQLPVIFIAPDGEAPRVKFLSPAPIDPLLNVAVPVAGTLKVAFSATDNVAIAWKSVRLDNQELDSRLGGGALQEVGLNRYELLWDTRIVPDGVYTLKAIARDQASNETDKSIDVKVKNGSQSGAEPILVLVQPVKETTVRDEVSIRARSLPAGALSRVDFYRSPCAPGDIQLSSARGSLSCAGTLIGGDSTPDREPNGDHFSTQWKTRQSPNGEMTLYAVGTLAKDGSTLRSVPPIRVTVDNPDATLPEVSIVHPVDGSVVSGVVEVSILAKGSCGGLSRVEFAVVGSPGHPGVGACRPPTGDLYACLWDTSFSSPGSSPRLVATAWDYCGRSVTSAPIKVTISRERERGGDNDVLSMAVISSQGGQVGIPGVTPAAFNVPAGLFPQPLNVTIAPPPQDALLIARQTASAAESQLSVAGPSVQITAADGPVQVTRFPGYAQVTVSYDPALLCPGCSPGLYYWAESPGSWQAVPGAQGGDCPESPLFPDTGQSCVTGPVDHLTQFVAMAAQTPTGAEDGGPECGEVFSYPNPAGGGGATVHAEIDPSESAQAQIFDLAGRLLRQAEMGPLVNGLNGRPARELKVDTTGLASGSYIVSVTAVKSGNACRTVRKFAVLK
ncbi:MAG: T9SS type A sorting domain-containing protein [Elusimicrobia bacterium]|nr:T9SS type A sorting domain-containing protein [Elusimicrobiota bacterium]